MVVGITPSSLPPLSLILASLAITLLQPSAPDTALRVRLERLLSEERLVGAAWATIDADGTIHTDAAGYRDSDARLPFNAATRFHVGSVAKAVLATGILRLVTEGRLGLDDPVRRILPALPIENPWESTQPVRVRHLLDHTSGLDDMRLRQMFSSRVAADAPLASAFRDGDLRVRVPPGSRLSYSNTGYTVLGMIIETVTGMRYEDYLDSQLLAPLGMRSSTFRFTTQEGSAADSSLAWGHLDKGQRSAALPVALRPAAQLTTTGHDLALFARFLMSDGNVDGKPFVRGDLMRSRGKPIGTEAAKAGLEAGYALGLARRDRYGAIGYCHNGNTVGFLANVCVYPEARKAFVIAVNTDSETARYDRLFEALAAHLRVDAPPTAPAAAPAADIGDWEGYYVASPSRFQTFAYLDAAIDVVRLRRAGDSLLFSRGFGPRRTLRPMGGYLFAAPDRRAPSHVLIRAGDERSVSDGISTFVKVGALRVIALRASLVLGVLGLLWFLVAGPVGFVRARRLDWRQPAAAPFLGILALIVAGSLFVTQTFAQLGDPTPASVSLALATALLPVAMFVGLWRSARAREGTVSRAAHAIAAIAVLQWCAVLAAWGMLPFRLWS